MISRLQRQENHSVEASCLVSPRVNQIGSREVPWVSLCIVRGEVKYAYDERRCMLMPPRYRLDDTNGTKNSVQLNFKSQKLIQYATRLTSHISSRPHHRTSIVMSAPEKKPVIRGRPALVDAARTPSSTAAPAGPSTSTPNPSAGPVPSRMLPGSLPGGRTTSQPRSTLSGSTTPSLPDQPSQPIQRLKFKPKAPIRRAVKQCVHMFRRRQKVSRRILTLLREADIKPVGCLCFCTGGMKLTNLGCIASTHGSWWRTEGTRKRRFIKR